MPSSDNLKAQFSILHDPNLEKINGSIYSTLLVTCPVTSVKLHIANYFLLTANPINEISSTIIGLAVSKSNLNLQFNTCNWTGDQQCNVLSCTVPCQATHLGGSTLRPRLKGIFILCSVMKVFPPP